MQLPISKGAYQMKHATYLLTILIFLSTAHLPAQPAPNPPAAEKPALSVQSYRYPSDLLKKGFVIQNKGQLRAPGMPAANADKAQVIEFLRLSHAVLLEHFQHLGVNFAQGSLIAFDPDNFTLVARTDAESHAQLKILAQEQISRLPSQIAAHLYLLESDAANVRELITRTATIPDHTAALADLQKQPATKSLETLRIDCRSGQRSVVSSNTEYIYSQAFANNNQGWSEAESSDMRYVGTQIEIDPVLGPDGKTININYALTYDYAPPRERWSPIAQRGDEILQNRVNEFLTAKTTSSITMLSGTSRIIGVWKPHSTNDPAKENRLQTAVLKSEIVPVIANINPQLQIWLNTHGVGLTPPVTLKTDDTLALPSGMILRRFKIPRSFLSGEVRRERGGAEAAAAPADPFASGQSPNEPSISVRLTARDILISQGIQFPPGSSANFNAATDELTVRNTPENMLAIEKYLEDIRGAAPRQIVVSLHIVQADAPFLRDLSLNTGTSADHTPAWQAIQAASAANQHHLQWLHTTRLEIRSGQRAVAEVGPFYQYVSQAQLSHAAPDGKEPAKEAPPQPQPPLMRTTTEERNVGLHFEIDPVLGPDKKIIDLNFSLEHHFAPPTIRPAQADRFKINIPQTDFHVGKTNTSHTVLDGAYGLVGLWKPKGTPELNTSDVLQAAFIHVTVVPLE